MAARLHRRALLLQGAAALAAPAVLPGTRASAQSAPLIRMMASPFGSQSFIPFVMETYDLPREFGFTLERIPFADGSAARVALTSGAADVAVQDWMDVARMRQAAIDIRAVAPFTTYVSVYAVPTESPVQSIPDLRGSRFGTYSRTGVDWMMFKALSQREHGFDIDTDMAVTEGAPTLLRGLMEQGSLDAGLLYSSITPPMEASGRFRSLFTAGDVATELGLPRAPFLTVNVRGAFADANPDLIGRFVAAYQRVIDILMSEDDPWVRQGATMTMEGRALQIYRDQMRGDMLRSFDSDTQEIMERAFAILLETAGPETLGMDAMPDGIITSAFQ